MRKTLEVNTIPIQIDERTSDERNMDLMLGIIKSHGKIHKFHLIKEMGISRSLYEKLSPQLQFFYKKNITYDRKTGVWKNKGV